MKYPISTLVVYVLNYQTALHSMAFVLLAIDPLVMHLFICFNHISHMKSKFNNDSHIEIILLLSHSFVFENRVFF